MLYRLDLLEPWGDEWFTLTTVPLPLNQIRTTVEGAAHPPLYYFLLHFWIHIPWPASPLVKMRAMSVLWTLLATTILDRRWLIELQPRVRRRFLVLWVLSPCLLLYARMARSYSMQLHRAIHAMGVQYERHQHDPDYHLAGFCRWTVARWHSFRVPA